LRDFHAGGDINVNGDVNITDNSQQYKPLNQCTNEELYEERQHRKYVLKKERQSKLNRLGLVWVVLGVLLASVGLYLFFIGQRDYCFLSLGIGGVLGLFATSKVIETPTVFEERQIATLNEIKNVLRERGAE
jgi:hypothetical protein